MGSDGMMQDRVGEGIDRLEEQFGSFPINQTTLAVSESDYDTARERAADGTIDVYVRVHDADGDVLHVVEEDGAAVPQCVNHPEEPLGVCVARTVREEAGVDCRIDDVARVTIAGVNDEADPDAATVYRLIALLDAEHERGHADAATWESDDPALPEYV